MHINSLAEFVTPQSILESLPPPAVRYARTFHFESINLNDQKFRIDYPV